jgi:spermidine synthase
MMDTTHEYAEHQPLWDGATGDVLIGGLGLGFVNQKLMDNPFVTSVTIIEKNQEVIDLVWDHCPKDSRFALVHADIDTWTPPNTSHWDYAWFDTWIGDNSTTREEYPEFIQSRYGSYCDQIGIWNQLP